MRAERQTVESGESLWYLTIGPATWALHFLLCYITAAVWCAKIAGREATLGPVRMAIVAYTAVAALIIGFCAWKGWQRRRYGNARTPFEKDTAADRHRFLGFATFLLASLSLVATLMQAMVALFFQDCR